MAAVISPHVFMDLKKGLKASEKDLIDAFGTKDGYEIAKKIIASGEIQKTQEFRDAEKEAKIKQVINLIMKNASDQNGHPYTEERLKRAIEEVHYNFDKRPAEEQMMELVEKLKTVIPIKIEVKRIKLIVPARFTGQAYGLFKDYKESENWLNNGDLEVIINIPAGLQIDFYDKINAIAHGAVRSEEMKQEEKK
jgi:ribosome maturation protein SDO1